MRMHQDQDATRCTFAHKQHPLWWFLLLSLLSLNCQNQPATDLQHTAIINGIKDLSNPAIGAIVDGQNTSFCTGTLIAQQLVLTAAHCIVVVRQLGNQQIQFRMDFPQPTNTFRSEFYNVQATHIHPAYLGSINTYENDLGLLVLTQKVTTAQPLPILQTPMDPNWKGKMVKVVGYGLIQTQPALVRADQKYAADIPIYQIDPWSFIQYDTITQKSACHGDSGGPALFEVANQLYVIGVTSVAYKATPAPQSNLTLCDGGAISTRTDTHINRFLQQYLLQYADLPKACINDLSCAPCGTCQQQQCQPLPLNTDTSTCRPCHTDQDCGLGLCHRFPDGYRCLQPCDGKEPGCCPTGYYCSTTYAPDPGGLALCIPAQHSCPPITCQQSAECGRGELCKDGKCEPDLAPPIPQLCQSCYSSQQCGPEGYCLDSPSSTGYCIQRCSNGNFCQKDTSCQQIAPGIDVCVPTKACFVSCDPDHPCPANYQCQQQQCTRKAGGVDGDFCNEQVPCSPNHQCLSTSPNLPMRCAKQCGAPTGSPGSPCNNGACTNGFQCLQLNGTTRACLETCTSSCSRGGQCYQLSAQLSVCLCQEDSDCQPNQFCNLSGLGTLGAGACSDKTTESSCQPGLECDANPPQGHFCRPQLGDRNVGQSCSFLQRCAKDLECKQLTSLSPTVCYETCSPQQTCKLGGTCLLLPDGQGYCLCTQSDQCPNGATCRLIGNSPNIGEVGFCQRTPLFQCRNNLDCPAEHICQSGACIFDSNKKNEPFPEAHLPTETTPDEIIPMNEPTPDASSQDAEIEPIHDTQQTNDTHTPETTTHETTTPDEPNTTPEPTTAPEPIVSPKGCGCQTSTNHPFRLLFLLLGLFSLALWQRH